MIRLDSAGLKWILEILKKTVNQLYYLELTVAKYLEAAKQQITPVIEGDAEVVKQETLVEVQPEPLKVRPRRTAALAAMERNR